MKRTIIDAVLSIMLLIGCNKEHYINNYTNIYYVDTNRNDKYDSLYIEFCGVIKRNQTYLDTILSKSKDKLLPEMTEERAREIILKKLPYEIIYFIKR